LNQDRLISLCPLSIRELSLDLFIIINGIF